MQNRPDADELDDTVEFEFDPTACDGLAVRAERSRDGWCVIEIYELDEDELSGPYESPPRHAKPGHGSQS